MKTYKTPAALREKLKAHRDAIKAAGGEAYAALLKKERAARALFRKRHPERIRSERKLYEKTRPGYLKKNLTARARRRGRDLGVEATVRVPDIEWVTHCPVLGIELDYSTPVGERDGNNPANPSLDRLDLRKGYVPGNVFVLSFRANTLKNNAMPEELEAVAAYMRERGAPRATAAVFDANGARKCPSNRALSGDPAARSAEAPRAA